MTKKEKNIFKKEAAEKIQKARKFLVKKFKNNPFMLQVHGADLVARMLGADVYEGEIDIFLLTMKNGEAVKTGWAGGGYLKHRWIEKDGYIIDGFLDDAIRNMLDQKIPRIYAPIPIIIRKGRESNPVDVVYSNAKKVKINTTDELFKELDEHLANKEHLESSWISLDRILDDRGLEHARKYWLWAQGAYYTNHQGPLPTRPLELNETSEIKEEEIDTKPSEPYEPSEPSKLSKPSMSSNPSMPIDENQDIKDDIISLTQKKPLKIVPSMIAITAGIAAAYIISMVFA